MAAQALLHRLVTYRRVCEIHEALSEAERTELYSATGLLRLLDHNFPTGRYMFDLRLRLHNCAANLLQVAVAHRGDWRCLAGDCRPVCESWKRSNGHSFAFANLGRDTGDGVWEVSIAGAATGWICTGRDGRWLMRSGGGSRSSCSPTSAVALSAHSLGRFVGAPVF